MGVYLVIVVGYLVFEKVGAVCVGAGFYWGGLF